MDRDIRGHWGVGRTTHYHIFAKWSHCQMLSTHTCLYPQISARRTLLQRSFLFRWAAINAETHNWKKCWEYMMVERSALNGTAVSLPPRGRECCSRRRRDSVRARGWRAVQRKDILGTWRNLQTHELTVSGGGRHKIGPNRVSSGTREGPLRSRSCSSSEDHRAKEDVMAWWRRGDLLGIRVTVRKGRAWKRETG